MGGRCGRLWRLCSCAASRPLTGLKAKGNPLLTGADQQVSTLQPGGNMEGKEVRFGIADSALFATVTTDASCGAINGWHDSYTPLGGMVPLVNIMLSEIVFGGVGAGLYGILIYVVLAVFIAGLMVGRTPEYLGKKIEAYDVKMAMLVALVFPLVILALTAISSVKGFGTSSISNPGPTDSRKSFTPSHPWREITAPLLEDSTATRSGTTLRAL